MPAIAIGRPRRAVTSGGTPIGASMPSSASSRRRSDSVLTRCGRPMASVQSTATPAERARARTASSFIRCSWRQDPGRRRWQGPSGGRRERLRWRRRGVSNNRSPVGGSTAQSSRPRLLTSASTAPLPSRQRAATQAGPAAFAEIERAPARCGARAAARSASSRRYSARLSASSATRPAALEGRERVGIGNRRPSRRRGSL